VGGIMIQIFIYFLAVGFAAAYAKERQKRIDDRKRLPNNIKKLYLQELK